MGRINWKILLWFGIPSCLSVYLGRALLLPGIPEEISLFSLTISKGVLIMCLFAILMLFAGIRMIRGGKQLISGQIKYFHLVIVLEGLFVGLVTGLLGAGGGFLIVPVLVMLCGLKMHEAVATSLGIIAMKSILPFLLSDALYFQIDWIFLTICIFFSIAGMFVGVYFSTFVSALQLKRYFGLTVLLMGCYVIYREIEILF